jgi:xylulokinase
VTIGTGAQIVLPASTVRVHPGKPVTHLYRAATEKGWYEMVAVLNGGLALNWVRQVLGATWAELYESAAAPARADDPIFLPHLNGERTPYMDPSLRGSWTGLDPRHDRVSLLRAALEGVAFAIRAALDSLPGVTSRVDHLRLAGGGSTAPAWRQMLADILGYPLHAVDIPAASGRGAALLGARAAGYLDEPALLRILTPRSRPVADPRDATAAVYALRRARFYRTLQALRHEKAGTAIGLADDASSTVPSPNGVEPGFPDSRSRAATTQ